MVHLQKRGSSVHGVFYETLPTYHRNANDYSDQGDSLLFFEGYSFSIDTGMWNSIREQAQIILQKGDSLYSAERYVDGNIYALYHNLQFSKGNSKYEEVFEKFDSFLKDAFLEKFLQARKPIMFKRAQ